jgi:signal transduction histidine kinase/ActR/RegA family two-component response regulator
VTGRSVFAGEPPRVVQLVGLVEDISDRKFIEQALREREERLQESDRRKDEFLAMLAHELRNPLAPIRTGLELIRIAGDTPGGVERVRAVMERQVTHMVRLVDDLLDVSRITSGKIHLQRKPTSLAEIVKSAVEANRAAMTAAKIQLTVNLPSAPCVLDVDPTRLVQVVSNLLHNASKFTPPNGHILVSAAIDPAPAASANGELVLSVADDGAGISSELLPRVFDLFAQGEASAARAQTGLGIGLALAKRLIEMHDGRIDATSAGAGRGATFTIRLPVKKGLTADAEASQRTAAGSVPHRVLIIDDNQDAAITMGMLVDELGGQSLVVHDGAAGVQAMASFRPDVVLLDIGMSGMDGYETCRTIRRESVGSDVFIVALTGWGQQQDKLRAADAGFDAHLIKPADPATLVRILSNLDRSRPAAS